MPQLDFSTFYSQTLWLSLCFLSTFLIVNHVFAPRIRKIFIERQHNISYNLHKSELAIAACKKINEELEETLNAAKQQAASLREKALVDRHTLLAKEGEEIEKSLTKKEAREFEKLKRYEAQLRAEIPTSSSHLSQEVIHKLQSLYGLSRDIIN